MAEAQSRAVLLPAGRYRIEAVRILSTPTVIDVERDCYLLGSVCGIVGRGPHAQLLAVIATPEPIVVVPAESQ